MIRSQTLKSWRNVVLGSEGIGITHLIDLDSVCILRHLGNFVVPRNYRFELFKLIFSLLLSGRLIRGNEFFDLTPIVLFISVLSWLRLLNFREVRVCSI